MVKVISFDVDGTLLDQEYNDLVWMSEVPRLYAEKYDMDFEPAYRHVIGEYAKVGEYDMKWYDLNYWLALFGLETSSESILEKYENRLRVYPDAERLFGRLKGFTLVLTTAMPRDFLGIKMKKLNGDFRRVFSTVSDFKSVKTREVYSAICAELGVSEPEVLHVGDLWEADYVAPREAGLHALCVDRKQEREGAHVIRSLDELEPRLQDINRRP